MHRMSTWLQISLKVTDNCAARVPAWHPVATGMSDMRARNFVTSGVFGMNAFHKVCFVRNGCTLKSRLNCCLFDVDRSVTFSDEFNSLLTS